MAAALLMVAAIALGLAGFAYCLATATPEPEYGPADPNQVEPEGDGVGA